MSCIDALSNRVLNSASNLTGAATHTLSRIYIDYIFGAWFRNSYVHTRLNSIVLKI